MNTYSSDIKIGLLEDRLPGALTLLNDCQVCPRQCHVNRTRGEVSHCGVDARLKVSSANLHHGEEPPISGTRGSGTIFLSGCNLKCVYCQNYPISQLHHGEYMTSDELAAEMVKLQRRGAHNINFVTPSHYVPQLMESMLAAYKSGLTLPIVYNSSGYDSVETLRLLDGIVEIYMPDMRYAAGETAGCYSGASDYPKVNQAAIREMHRQTGKLVMDAYGIALRGLLVRHLILPNSLSGSKEIFDFIAREISSETYVSLMSQYFPAHKAMSIRELDRRLMNSEYKEALRTFEDAGLINGFAQPYSGI